MNEAEITPKSIGINIQRQRKSVGMNASGLAAALKTHRNTIANWESGKSEPSSSELVRIANTLGCTLNDLMAVVPAPVVRFTHYWNW